MRLIDIINKETDKLHYETYVEYRTHLPGGEDIFTGCCKIDKAGNIKSIDYDTYSADDEVSEYEIWYDDIEQKNCLTVWCESEWISG